MQKVEFIDGDVLSPEWANSVQNIEFSDDQELDSVGKIPYSPSKLIVFDNYAEGDIIDLAAPNIRGPVTIWIGSPADPNNDSEIVISGVPQSGSPIHLFSENEKLLSINGMGGISLIPGVPLVLARIVNSVHILSSSYHSIRQKSLGIESVGFEQAQTGMLQNKPASAGTSNSFIPLFFRQTSGASGELILGEKVLFERNLADDSVSARVIKDTALQTRSFVDGGNFVNLTSIVEIAGIKYRVLNSNVIFKHHLNDGSVSSTKLLSGFDKESGNTSPILPTNTKKYFPAFQQAPAVGSELAQWIIGNAQKQAMHGAMLHASIKGLNESDDSFEATIGLYYDSNLIETWSVGRSTYAIGLRGRFCFDINVPIPRSEFIGAGVITLKIVTASNWTQFDHITGGVGESYARLDGLGFHTEGLIV